MPHLCGDDRQVVSHHFKILPTPVCVQIICKLASTDFTHRAGSVGTLTARPNGHVGVRLSYAFTPLCVNAQVFCPCYVERGFVAAGGKRFLQTAGPVYDEPSTVSSPVVDSAQESAEDGASAAAPVELAEMDMPDLSTVRTATTTTTVVHYAKLQKWAT